MIPIAVDLLAIRPIERRADSLNIVTLGTLYYPPSADGIRWFIDAVIRLLSDKALQTQLSTNGRCLVESNYDWQVTLKDLDNVYRQFA